MPLVSSSETRAIRLDLRIQQGEDLTHTISVQNSNGSVFSLTGYTARMMVRETIESSTVLLDCTVANGKLGINGVSGQVSIILTSTETAAMTWRSGVYDLEIISSGGIVTRLVEGNITVIPEVTRV